MKIGQEEVINFLKKCEEPKTRKQIADAIKEDPIKISHALKNLIKWNEISFIELDRDEAVKRVTYFLHRRTKFYFIKQN